MDKVFSRKKFEIYGFVICSVSLIFIQLYYAGILSNLWYVINLLFWGVTLIVHIYFDKHVNNTKWICAFSLIGSALVVAYFLGLPNYSAGRAKKIILEHYTGLIGVTSRNPQQYQGFMDESTYLIVFETEPLTAFWVDAYTGDYGEFKIKERLPFIQ